MHARGTGAHGWFEAYGTPAEIGRFVAYLCSEAASPITGAALSIDGGIMAG